MIDAKVLLEDGEKVHFTAADIMQAAAFIEKQYYPYVRVDITRMEDTSQTAVEGQDHG